MAATSTPLSYPSTRKLDHWDDYHGQRIADPYRWLEDADSPETKAWIEAQNRVTFALLESIPERAAIRQRLTELWNYERYGVPARQGERYFFSKNDGLQNQSVLYTAATLEAPPRVLLDPNRLSADGTVALAGSAVSEDGRWLAYGLSGAGSDWQTWKVRNVQTGEDLPDELKWIKFSGAAWTHDHQGFFYSRYDEPKPGAQYQAVNRFPKVYYHRLGTPQTEDRLIYHRPDQPNWGFYSTVTEDGRYLILTVTRGTDTRNGVFYLDLQASDGQVVELLNEFDADYSFIGNEGPVFWFRTDWQAPRGRVIAIDTRQPQRAAWREIIPQTKDTLRGVSVVGERFMAHYLRDAHSAVRIHHLNGRLDRELKLPGLGSVSGFGGKRTDRETFFAFTSYTTPGTIYRLDFSTMKTTVWRAPQVKFNPNDYLTRQVFYRSKDGTRVPMFITHRKGLRRDGQRPVYLYGYGGFNISLTPSFSVASLVWMEMGGVLAIPNLRGGGEYGEEWHRAGMKNLKQNVFDDFIAAAEWLVQNRYTRPDKLAIGGGSNGGLLVGACMTQRPELFGAALPAVGVMDMLRFHKFTIGWAWTAEYGNPDLPEDFRYLLAYSPLHQLKPGIRYPATLITTADHDDRVVPAHSFKFAARLQECQAGPAPVLIRIETRAGHGAGKPTSKMIEEAVDRWAFLVRALDLRPRLP
ncbi:prolyl oligopeptidase family serine peptidase [Fontisphaera persica]|uniref:prolyl oligopeptidase family serine peptidase n=1 Tax=Fontisphaera persica TaxID=2974023 RepID=UPI0024C04F87|nr:prolyl oligopeptidase family serine peptidase [Fontisphaera persica]WCJ61204.1 prolyl oligopeptidase family serine peptidase [Fontisphaera persica]